MYTLTAVAFLSRCRSSTDFWRNFPHESRKWPVYWQKVHARSLFSRIRLYLHPLKCLSQDRFFADYLADNQPYQAETWLIVTCIICVYLISSTESKSQGHLHSWPPFQWIQQIFEMREVLYIPLYVSPNVIQSGSFDKSLRFSLSSLNAFNNAMKIVSESLNISLTQHCL